MNPTNKLFSWQTLSWLDIVLVVGAVVVGFIVTILGEGFDTLGYVATVTGVCCVVLGAKGSMLTFPFGMVNTILCGIIALRSNLYADAVLQTIYYFPMQFIGWYMWCRRTQEGDSSRVRPRRLSVKNCILLSAGSALAVAATGWVLHNFTDDTQPYKDAAFTVLSIIGQLMMTRAYAEQWFLWLAVNMTNLSIWIIGTINGEPHASLMLVMSFFYLINSINGIIYWFRNSHSQE